MVNALILCNRMFLVWSSFYSPFILLFQNSGTEMYFTPFSCSSLQASMSLCMHREGGLEENSLLLALVQLGDPFGKATTFQKRSRSCACFPKTKETGLHCWKLRAWVVLPCYHPITRRP